MLITLFWPASEICFAQEFQPHYYSEKDGLSDNSVTQVLADSVGFLWVATAAGLNRFDGNAFDRYLHIPGKDSSIANDNIQKLYLDKQKRLWIGTNAGLSLYQRGSFRNYFPDTSVLPIGGISFGALCADERGRIWVGAKNELLIFDPATEKFASSGWASFAGKVAPENGNHLRVVVLGLLPKQPGELWVLTTYGLFSVVTQSGSFTYYPNPAITDYWGYELDYQDSDGIVWMSSFCCGLSCFHSCTGKWAVPDARPDKHWTGETHGVMPYCRDSLLYTMGTALVLWDRKNSKVTGTIRITANPGNNSPVHASLPAKGNCIALSNGCIWLGTNEGLVRLTPVDSRFKFIQLCSSGAVGKVYHTSDPDVLFFTKYSPDNANYTTWIRNGGRALSPLLTPDHKALSFIYQYYAEDGKGSVYLTTDQHIYRYGLRAGRLVAIPLAVKRNSHDDYNFRNIVVDRDGDVWIRTISQGIMKYSPATKTTVFERAIPISGTKEINALYYDSMTHCLWVAEEFNGVFVYDIGARQTKHYGLPLLGGGRNAAIVAISGDGQGHIWLTDLQSGIIQYDHRSGLFTRLTTADGLLSNNCLWTIVDHLGMLWIETDKGLCKFNFRTREFLQYRQDAGYQFPFDGYLTRDKEGNIFMPVGPGYFTWNEHRIADPPWKGSLYLRELLPGNAQLSPDGSYRLGYQSANLRLLFGLLSFDTRSRVIEYSLNGDPWAAADLHSYLYFANLSPGDFELRVRVKNEPSANLRLQFEIDRPFWKKWWFLGLVLSLAVAGVVLITKSRLRAIRKESVLRQELIESEMSALRSQMNPHFIFNTLNSINSYIIENKKDEASDYLDDFSWLMRIILEHSRMRTVTLTDELHALRLYLELEFRRLEGSFDYEIVVATEIDAMTVYVPPLIIQPFVENAIWHGIRGRQEGGHLRIAIKTYASGLLIVVEDNGIGRAAAARKATVTNQRSFATVGTRQRILLNEPKSSIDIEDLFSGTGEPVGTRVNIYVYQNSANGKNN